MRGMITSVNRFYPIHKRRCINSEAIVKRVLSLILGGGRGTRLFPLTQHRSKPAVPVAGKYRLIDVPISNCLNSGLRRIYVLTQFLSVSLHRHIANTYKFDPFSQGYVEVLAAQQTNEGSDWYQGTADAVRQQIRYVEEDKGDEVLILSGDQLYRMDYVPMIQMHRETGADATIAVIPIPTEETIGLGLARVDDDGWVKGFVEKPKTEEERAPVRMSVDWLKKRGVKDTNRQFLGNMGIYLFKKDSLLELLNAPPKATDFGKEIFPRCVDTHKVMTYVFEDYWEDLGTVKAYHDACLALAGPKPPFDFHVPEGVIYTRMRFLPASRLNGASLKDCLISDGCVVQEGSRLEECVLGVRSHIGKNVQMKRTIVIGADRFETDSERQSNEEKGLPSFSIGEGSVIENAIVDKDARIGRNVKLLNQKKVEEQESDLYVIRDGIIVIPRGTVVPDNTVI